VLRTELLLLLHRSCYLHRLSSTARQIYHVSHQCLRGKDRACLERLQTGGASRQSKMRQLAALHCQS